MKVAADQLKSELRCAAGEVGFVSCRIADCALPAHAARFREWLREGAAGEMEWLHRGEEKRCEPQLVLPGAKSVVVLALNYWQGDNGGTGSVPSARGPENGRHGGRPSDKARGRIARYAWGDDYHGLIEKKLKHLDSFLKKHGGTQKCYVDTGPLLERDHAAKAGVGWQGKSTMLVDQQLGTWFFLAEILTTLALPPDPPQRERCGNCTRCITACPTGAITQPHRLDARRCISYLTIESKGSIPIDLRPLIGNRIYGCDDCLDACPWNRFAVVSREAAFAARPATAGMSLREYLRLTEEEFRVLFRRSPIKRIKRRGFLRNVCVALGNVGERGDLPALEAAMQDPEPLIAEHAAWAVQEIWRRDRGASSRVPSRPELRD